MSKQRAILIAGPTASGKSAVAIALAQALNGVIINADSMQVYDGLRILTARPNESDEQRVPHMLYGFVDAADAYSTGRWVDDVRGVISEVENAGQFPIITGGTGLYFKALLEGLSPIPDIPEDVRAHWRMQARDKSAGELHAMLQERDPEMAGRLRPSDPQRIARALEVLDATGRSLAEWQSEPGEAVLDVDDVLRIRISPPREYLYEKIDGRFDAMLDEGALGEVEVLASRNLDPDLPAMRALGVRPFLALLTGDLSRDDAVAQAKMETRRYAKRQETWARSNMIAWNWIKKKEMESLMSVIFSFIDV